MSDRPAPPRHVASQFGDAFDAALKAARPELQVTSLARRLSLPLPDGADVLLAFPWAPALRSTPEPAGWSRGLRWIQLISVGVDAYPRWFIERSDRGAGGPPVSTAHGTSSETIADYALACVLQHALRLPERQARRAEDWRQVEAPALAGQRLGLYGFGGIGSALARRALALGLEVRALRRSAAPFDVDGVGRAHDLAELAAWSDHLVLVAPGTDETRHAVDDRVLAAARPGLHLVNVARGSLVDQGALRAALDDGRVARASLDVCEPEPLPEGHWLYTHPRVQLTPHTCAISPQVQAALLQKVLRGLEALARGDTPSDLVDLARGY